MSFLANIDRWGEGGGSFRGGGHGEEGGAQVAGEEVPQRNGTCLSSPTSQELSVLAARLVGSLAKTLRQLRRFSSSSLGIS